MTEYVIFFPLSINAISLWFIICNNRAYKQREILRSIVFDYDHTEETYETLYHVYQTVTYAQHVWLLFTLRNPYRYYVKEMEND